MSNYPPIYKFEATSARDPKSVDITLKYDTPKETEGKYGTQYRYSVSINGDDYTIFATPGLHKAIQDTRGRAGDVLSVIRIGEGKDTRWDVVRLDGSQGANADPIDDPFLAPEERNIPKKTSQTIFYDNLKRYEQAWIMAERFLTKHGGQGDLNAVSFTFYKMAQDAGYDLMNEEENNEAGKQ